VTFYTTDNSATIFCGRAPRRMGNKRGNLMSDIASVPDKAPFFRRLWVVILMTCLLIPMPVALIILLTGEVYRKRQGTWQPISASVRYVYGGTLVLWLVAALTRAVLLNPGLPTVSPSESQQADGHESSEVSDGTVLLACNSSDAAEMVKGALESDGTTKVEDYGRAEETYFDKVKNVRHCKAEAALSQGGLQTIAYQLFLGPSGKLLVQTEQGNQAETMLARDQMAKEYERDTVQTADANGSSTATPTTRGGTCDIPSIAKDTPYPQARALLIAKGNVPTPPKEQSEGSYCADADHAETCRQMPEIEDCSADGHCRMNFTAKSGAPFEVSVFGDGPNDPAASVEGVKCPS
jgi:hypothetical protein